MSKQAEEINFPTVESYLPKMMDFVARLAQDYQAGLIRSWQVMAARVQSFFTAAELARVDKVVPGWRSMAAYGDGITLVHVMVVFTALSLCLEFRQASPRQQMLIKWAVLFHDIAKIVEKGERDWTHGFRSAAMAGAMLPKLGFAVRDGYEGLIEDWVVLTGGAITRQGDHSEFVQDNRKLPEIVEGIERLFGAGSPAALIIQTVLFHMSINTLQAWPQAAPLTPVEIKRYLSPELFPLLKVMMLVDNDGWTLFESTTKEQYRQETLAVFDALALS